MGRLQQCRNVYLKVRMAVYTVAVLLAAFASGAPALGWGISLSSVSPRQYVASSRASRSPITAVWELFGINHVTVLRLSANIASREVGGGSRCGHPRIRRGRGTLVLSRLNGANVGSSADATLALWALRFVILRRLTSRLLRGLRAARLNILVFFVVRLGYRSIPSSTLGLPQPQGVVHRQETA